MECGEAMKIEGPFGVPGSPARARRAGTPQAKDSFSDHLEADAAAHGAGPAAPLAPVQTLVALQEVPDPIEGRRAEVRRGHDLLDELDALKLALVFGRLPGSRLAAIAKLVRERRAACADPVLAGLLAEIELRAEVELAKLERVGQSSTRPDGIAHGDPSIG
jgi:hypothetical protein